MASASVGSYRSEHIKLRAEDGRRNLASGFDQFQRVPRLIFFERIQQPIVENKQLDFLQPLHVLAVGPVASGHRNLHQQQVFKTITVDNGSEFADFAQVEQWSTYVYFAHSYTSWERPQNECHNGLFRAFVPKGASFEDYSAECIMSAADELNGRPRKKLGYRIPVELFEAFLDSVFAA